MSGASERIHATAISVAGRCALIRGPSNSGKSDLALRCLALAPSALLAGKVELVADDQVILSEDDRRGLTRLVATAPPSLRGKLEVRGLGILEVAARDSADVALIVDLVREGVIERFPDPWPKARILGVEVPAIRLFPFESSAPMKVVAALLMAARQRRDS